MPVPVLVRRTLFEQEQEGGDEVWICEACGEDWEEPLAVYEVIRVTRSCSVRALLLCSSCADRIPHGRVVSS